MNTPRFPRLFLLAALLAAFAPAAHAQQFIGDYSLWLAAITASAKQTNINLGIQPTATGDGLTYGPLRITTSQGGRTAPAWVPLAQYPPAGILQARGGAMWFHFPSNTSAVSFYLGGGPNLVWSGAFQIVGGPTLPIVPAEPIFVGLTPATPGQSIGWVGITVNSTTYHSVTIRGVSYATAPPAPVRRAAAFAAATATPEPATLALLAPALLGLALVRRRTRA